MKTKKYADRALKYAKDVVDGKIIIGADAVNACKRFLSDLERDDLEFNTKQADATVSIMEGLLVHRKGEALDGTPLLGKPFKLQDWEIFIIYNLLGFFVAGTNERRFKEAFIMTGRKNGKALSLDTKIPTPDGWRTISEIHPGDYVFGKNGQPVKVCVESEIFHKPMYEVAFEDGEVVKASADHVWTVQTKKSREAFKREIIGNLWSVKNKYHVNGGWFDITTDKLAKDYVRIRKDKKGKDYKYRVPMNDPVLYSEKELPVDPYFLGVWLGDGTSSDTTITCSHDDKAEMMRNISECGFDCRWYEYKDRAGAIGVEKKYRGKVNPLREALREIGVFQNKHIPDIYLQGSVYQRLELLRGLMDTDGYCSAAGQCEFAQKSEIITDQLRELLSSLGIKSTKRIKKICVNGKICTAYSVMFFTDLKIFKLKRKSARLKKKLSERMKAKSIVSIKEIPSEPSKCIAVEAEDHLFLCGERFTPTHNTSFIAGLAFAMAIIQRHSGSTIYVVAAALKQALESFQFLVFSLKYKGIIDDFQIRDNSFEHSIKYTFEKDGKPDGSIEIQIMASNPDAQDSFNCNFAIADEVAAYKKPSQYNRFKEAQASYTNRLMVGITTAGDNVNSFGHGRMEYAVKVASGTVKDDTLFSFVCRADQDDKGNVDYTNPLQHQKANPSYGVTIRPEELKNDSLQAQNDPQQRKDFLSRRLNIYTSAIKAWFDIDEFRASDGQYNWTLEELAKLPVYWYGGADLSRMYDLTAAALYGCYEGVDIVITHAFFPISQAVSKAEEDNIPLFGWQDDGWLTMSNSPTVNIGDIVNWFIQMRNMGFKIRAVGHDRKFAGEEYFPAMTKAGFFIIDTPQYFYLKSEGFRHIERMVKNGKFYYLHSDAYEYCVSNVSAIEKTDDAVQYQKIQSEQRIDLFDASVFACIQLLHQQEKEKQAQDWWK